MAMSKSREADVVLPAGALSRVMTSWRIQKAAIVTGFLAGANELGLHGAFASTLLMVAAPVAVSGFIYEVSSMRQAQLTYEARDRAAYAARIQAETLARQDDINATRRTAAKVENPDMTSKLDAMLASRSVIVDTFGGDPSAVAPVYIRIIKQMLRDDDETLASLSSKKKSDAAHYADTLADRETRLREVHAKLTRLAGA